MKVIKIFYRKVEYKNHRKFHHILIKPFNSGNQKLENLQLGILFLHILIIEGAMSIPVIFTCLVAVFCRYLTNISWATSNI